MHWQEENKIENTRTHTHTEIELKCIPTIREEIGSLALLTPNQVMHTYTRTPSVSHQHAEAVTQHAHLCTVSGLDSKTSKNRHGMHQ